MAYGPFIPEADRTDFFAQHYTPEGHRRAVINAGMLYLVAERDVVPVAFLLARQHARGIHLDRFYADPRFWRGGAGQRLWDELVAWARKLKARRIFFEVAAEAEAGPNFYRKQGCQKRGEVVEPVGTTPVRVARYVFDLPKR